MILVHVGAGKNLRNVVGIENLDVKNAKSFCFWKAEKWQSKNMYAKSKMFCSKS